LLDEVAKRRDGNLEFQPKARRDTGSPLIRSLHIQSRVFGIAIWSRGEEGASVRDIEQCIARKPRGQIGIRDKEPAEGDCIRLYPIEQMVSRPGTENHTENAGKALAE
jgi:hypothetical protein